jgi:hypothetical protein
MPNSGAKRLRYLETCSSAEMKQEWGVFTFVREGEMLWPAVEQLRCDNARYFPIFQETTDPEVKELYFKHLFTQPPHKAFTTSAVGVDRVRKGLCAFHGESEAFRIISETYYENEKCRLKYIRLVSTTQMALTARKGSPYKEHIRQR